MRVIGDILISTDLWDADFECDPDACAGECCRRGDRGSPITECESEKIMQELDNIKELIPGKSHLFLQAGVSENYKGVLHIRELGHNIPCPLSFLDDKNIIRCSLHALALRKREKPHSLKPIWCSLFPITAFRRDDMWNLDVQILPFCRGKSSSRSLLAANKILLADLFGEAWMKDVLNKLREENRRV